MLNDLLYIENFSDEKSKGLENAISLASLKGLNLSVVFVIQVQQDVADWVEVQQKQIKEATEKAQEASEKIRKLGKENGVKLDCRVIQGTGEAMERTLKELTPAGIVLVGKLDMGPLAGKGIHNLEELSSRLNCPVLPIERLIASQKSKSGKHLARFLIFGCLSAASYIFFFPMIEKLNPSLFMKGTVIGALAVMIVVPIHAYIYGSFTEYFTKIIGLDKQNTH